MAQVSKINMGGIDYDIRDKVLEQEVANIKPMVNQGTINNAADEEDLTSENNLLKLKDRQALSGMGYVILRKNKAFAEQVTQDNTIYEIRYDFDLNGVVELPTGCILNFNGGSVSNGTLIGNKTSFSAAPYRIFGDVTLGGTWVTDVIHTEWFGSIGNGESDDSFAFNKAFEFLKNCSQTTQTSIENKSFCLKLIGTYKIGVITIPRGLQLLSIKGGAIVGGGFHFIGGELPNPSTPSNDPNDLNPSGYRVTIEDVSFFNEVSAEQATISPIVFDYSNKEYGEYIIRHCSFVGCDTAITIKRRSCRVYVEHCTIYKCKKAILLHNTDYAIIRDNWIQDGNYLWENDHSHVEIISEVEGDLFVERNIFVPSYEQKNTNPSWIRSGKNIVIKGNRFSNENISIYPLRIGYDYAYAYGGFDANNNIFPLAEISENIMNGASAILLDKFIGRINIHNNTGWTSGKPILRLVGEVWKDSHSSANVQYKELYNYYQSLVSKKTIPSDGNYGKVENSKLLTISIKENIGLYMPLKNNDVENMPTEFTPAIPDILLPFIANLRHSSAQNYVYEKSISSEAKKSILSIKLPPIYFDGNYRLNGILTGEEAVSYMSKFVIMGTARFVSNIKYCSQFALFIGFDCLYKDGQIVFVPKIKSLYDTEWAGFEYSAKINGLDSIAFDELKSTISEGNATLDIVVEYTGSYGNIKVKWQNAAPLSDVLADIGAFYN